MSQVYGKAAQVLIWGEEAEDDTPMAFDQLNHIHEKIEDLKGFVRQSKRLQ